MADLSPLLGDERKSDFWDLRAAVDPLRTCCTADTPGKQTPSPLCARLTRLLNSVRCARIELFTAVFWRMNNGNHSLSLPKVQK
jgi:hypothetical protein